MYSSSYHLRRRRVYATRWAFRTTTTTYEKVNYHFWRSQLWRRFVVTHTHTSIVLTHIRAIRLGHIARNRESSMRSMRAKVDTNVERIVNVKCALCTRALTQAVHSLRRYASIQHPHVIFLGASISVRTPVACEIPAHKPSAAPRCQYHLHSGVVRIHLKIGFFR